MLKRILSSSNPTNLSLIFISLMFLLPAVNMYHRVPVNSFYSEWIAAVLGIAALAPLFSKITWSDTINIPQISLFFFRLGGNLRHPMGKRHIALYAICPTGAVIPKLGILTHTARQPSTQATGLEYAGKHTGVLSGYRRHH